MAEFCVDYEDEDGFEFERNGETFVAFGRITADFIFDFYQSDENYEWSDESISAWHTDLLFITDADGNEKDILLSEDEYEDLTEYLKEKAERYFQDYGVCEYAESCSYRDLEFEKEY